VALVLVIDDDPDIHRLLAVLLHPEQVELVHALSAEDGLAMARARTPDLVLLDMRMPDADGDEVCQLLKDDPRTAGAAVIMLSAADDTDTKVRCFDLGAVDYVTKPFQGPELQARVRAALRTQHYLALLAREARLDGLTGLWNRSYLDDALTRAVATHRRHGRPFCLAMVDVDHFKRLNDTHGHPFGDRVLQEIARALQAAVREADIVCRYGGEEFALLLADARRGEGEAACRRVHEHLARMRLHSGRERVSVTASVGLASSVGNLVAADPCAAILEAADRALYAAKAGGRNQTRVAGGTSEAA